MSNVSFYLTGIEMGAKMAARNVRMLPEKPAFETWAEDALEEARKTMTEALEEIEQAQAEYQLKPVA
jgi:DNA-binding GntR family transcriptional regulator